MIGALLVGAALAADPAALRAPLDAGAVTADYGTLSASVATSIGEEGAVGAVWSPGAVGLMYGQRRRLTGKDKPWGIDGTLSAGLAATLVRPGAALLVSGSLMGGYSGEDGQAVAGAVVPLAVGGPPAAVAVPLLVELRVGRRLGDVWLGGRATTGAVLAGDAPALRAELGFWVRVRLAGSSASLPR